MSTPKDAKYKQRQAEFNRLNKEKYSEKLGSIDPHGNIRFTVIKLAKQAEKGE